jgi:hypothetical protein
MGEGAKCATNVRGLRRAFVSQNASAQWLVRLTGRAFGRADEDGDAFVLSEIGKPVFDSSSIRELLQRTGPRKTEAGGKLTRIIQVERWERSQKIDSGGIPSRVLLRLGVGEQGNRNLLSALLSLQAYLEEAD